MKLKYFQVSKGNKPILERRKNENKKSFLTDEQVEQEIERLNQSDAAQLFI